ncbi:SLC13 family permease [Roseibium sp. RKSG952]|uniref:SLC13 family permease n=1 Tax=Roseibium sp. RKSG952 TaxID=2529384 RepID=UPI0012BC9998|nr:TRAP transporter large permease subunit [Roseibium sp. RKSG952]
MSFSLAVSIAVFTLIAIREWLPSFLKIWHVMTAGAFVLIATGTITPKTALDAIDWNVMLYLFSVFSIGRALYENGISHRIAGWMVGWRTPGVSLVAFMMLFALVAAILTNDAAAIIGTPIALMLAHQTGADQRTFLIALCVAVTIGSMTTPIGNPQNLLIAASGEVPAPMVTFVHWLIVPTLICLGGSALWLSKRMVVTTPEGGSTDMTDTTEGTQWPVLLAIAVLVVLVTVESILAATGSDFGYPLGVAAAIACLPVYLFDGARMRTFVRLDWPTLVFFVSMFIVTGALLDSGSLQSILGEEREHMNEPLVTAGISFFGSQIFSNVPLVDMYLKLLPSFEVPNLMMLAGVSTLAGNVFIISAASNVIVLQMADRMGATEVTFTQFMKDVLPIGIVSTGVTIGWILLLEAHLSGKTF